MTLDDLATGFVYTSDKMDTYGHEFTARQFIWPQTVIKMLLGRLYNG